MGREVRRVPKDWQHPQELIGGSFQFKPLFERDVAALQEEWDLGATKWSEGFVKDWRGGWKPRKGSRADAVDSYCAWAGTRPDAADYMPQWVDAEKTHLMMYETVTEGTPISPAFATPEELARWLADNNASACGDERASYEGWLRVCKGGFVPSMVRVNGVFTSGVDGL